VQVGKQLVRGLQQLDSALWSVCLHQPIGCCTHAMLLELCMLSIACVREPSCLWATPLYMDSASSLAFCRTTGCERPGHSAAKKLCSASARVGLCLHLCWLVFVQAPACQATS
jgi:hypothetical protein